MRHGSPPGQDRKDFCTGQGDGIISGCYASGFSWSVGQDYELPTQDSGFVNLAMATQDNTIEKASLEQVEDVSVTKEAKVANQREHETTLWQALKDNKKAAMWSAIISLTIIMEGYDIGRISRRYCVFCLLTSGCNRAHIPVLRLPKFCETVRTLGLND